MSQAAATGEELSYSDLVRRLYDLEHLATAPGTDDSYQHVPVEERAGYYAMPADLKPNTGTHDD